MVAELDDRPAWGLHRRLRGVRGVGEWRVKTGQCAQRLASVGAEKGLNQVARGVARGVPTCRLAQWASVTG